MSASEGGYLNFLLKICIEKFEVVFDKKKKKRYIHTRAILGCQITNPFPFLIINKSNNKPFESQKKIHQINKLLESPPQDDTQNKNLKSLIPLCNEISFIVYEFQACGV